MKKFTASIKSARVATQPTYTPAYIKAGSNKEVQAMLSIPTMVTNPPFYVEEEKRDGDTVLLYITAYGKQADHLAKYLGVGKEFDCELSINSYPSKVKDPNTKQVVMGSTGEALTTIKHGFNIIPGTVHYGADSAVQIAKEMQDGRRDLGWDGNLPIGMVELAFQAGTLAQILEKAKQGPALHKARQEALKKLEYTPGMTEFGHAKVTLSPHAVNMNAYANNVANAVATATAPTSVDGFTYADMKAAGWEDDALLTADGGKWAILVPRKPPVPPAKVTAPVPPVAPTPPATTAEQSVAV